MTDLGGVPYRYSMEWSRAKRFGRVYSRIRAGMELKRRVSHRARLRIWIEFLDI